LSEAIEDLSYIPNIRKNEIHTAVTTFEQCLGSNERILSSPVPLFYTRWTARFLFLWLAFSPFALYPHVINTAAFLSSIPTTSMLSMGQMLLRSFILVPMMYAVSMFMFGIDEIAMQCEEPFSILPQQGYCNEIYNNCIEIANYDYYETDATAAAPNATVDKIQSSRGGGSDNAMDMAAAIGRLPEIKNDDTIQPVVPAQPQQRDPFTNNAETQYMMGHSQRL
jgi:ion channel-forming bestrophin family protein